MTEAVRLATRLGSRLASRLGVPPGGAPWFAASGDSTLSFDFTQQRAWEDNMAEPGVEYGAADLDELLTFTAAGTRHYFNSSGVLTAASTDVMRFDYDPVTLEPKGILIEGARTNSIRNNTMVGASAPSTIPTNWIAANLPSGVTVAYDVVTDSGMTCLDVILSGSGTGTFQLNFENTTQIVASSGQAWSASIYAKLTAGALSNITPSIRIREGTSGGGLLTDNSVSFSPVSTWTRAVVSLASAGASTERVTSRILLGIAGAVSATIRIALPQLELGAFASSPIPTSTTATTRAADVLTAAVGDWFNASEGTLVVESSRAHSDTSAVFPRVLQIDSGANNNVLSILWSSSLNRYYFASNAAGVGQADLGLSGASQTAVNKIAAAYKLNDFAASVNGATALTDTSGTLPSGLTTVRFGRTTVSDELFGHIRRVSYIPRRVSNAELQALSA